MKSKEEKVLDYFTENNSEVFWRAYYFAERVHKNHKRRDGTPYIVHPIEICYIFLTIGVVEPIIHAKSMCHDVIEEARDQEGIIITERQIAEEVDPLVAPDVVILTKEIDLSFMEMIEYIRRIEEKVHTALVKMGDRLSNIRHGMHGVFPDLKAGYYSYETEYHILPMSERIITLAESNINFSGKAEFEKYVWAFRGLRASIKSILKEGHSSFILDREIERYKTKCKQLEKTIAEMKK